MTPPGLSAVSEHDLCALAAALERGDFRAGIDATSLQSRGFGHLVGPLLPYASLGPRGVRALIEVALGERAHQRAPRLTLVWTGEDPGVSLSRHTRVVLPELFSRAREHVLIAGYSIDHGAELFAGLHRSMAEHGVRAELFVDIDQLRQRLHQQARREKRDWATLSAPLGAAPTSEARGREVVALFFRLMWPFGDPRPDVYFDPRTAEEHGGVSLHAKCVVIDHAYTLITSANLTERGQSRNLEAGVAIEDRSFAASLERQWRNLVDAGVLVKGT